MKGLNWIKRILPLSVIDFLRQRRMTNVSVDKRFCYDDVMGVSLFDNTNAPVLQNEDMRTYFENNYKLNKRHLSFYNDITSQIDFAGKNVLEIGGSNTPVELALEHIGAAKWVCLDTPGQGALKMFDSHYSKLNLYDDFKKYPLDDVLKENDYVIYTRLADDMPSSFYEKFDIVVSQNCFEHILNLSFVLDLIYKALKPGGILYSRFGPLFSAHKGNHININDNELNFKLSMKDYPQDLAHLNLLMGYAELSDFLRDKYGDAVAGKYTAKIKFPGGGGGLNGLFYEDYIYILHHSMFKQKALFPNYFQYVNPAHVSRLRKLYPGYRMFDVGGIVMQGIKSPNI